MLVFNRSHNEYCLSHFNYNSVQGPSIQELDYLCCEFNWVYSFARPYSAGQTFSSAASLTPDFMYFSFT